MSKIETHKCDMCGKTIDCHENRDFGVSGYVRPPYVWFQLNFHSNYQDELGKQVNTSGEVCSIDCARKLLTRAIDKLATYEVWLKLDRKE